MPGPLNKTVTVQAATAAVAAITFHKVGSTIQATASGSVDVSDGTKDAESVTWTLSGAAETTVRNFMDGAALTKWRDSRGLEAP